MQSSRVAWRGVREKSQVLVLVIAALTILINLACLFFGAYCLAKLWSSQSQSSTNSEDPEGSIACLPCDLRPSDPLMVGLTKHLINNSQYCCAKDSTGMSNLMELALRKHADFQDGGQSHESLGQVSSTSNVFNFNFSHASAHKQLLPSQLFNYKMYQVPQFNSSMFQLHLNVSCNARLTDHVRQVNVVESGFEVIHPGVYYVYSNVMYKPDSSMVCARFKFQTWEQNVMWLDSVRGTQTKILNSIHTCANRTNRDKETSFTGGVFKLNKGDRLEVSTSGIGLLSYNPESSYFGLFILGSPDTPLSGSVK